MTVPAKSAAASPGEIMESVIIKGDLSKLTPEERASYYMKVCQSIGLNPLTRPLEYIMLSGRLTLYAKRDAADQLRKINGISISIVSQDHSDGLLTIHVRARDASGREDEDLGVVALPDTLRGEAKANTVLKCVTKAKRRVTLSISGLGFLDETEVGDIPAAAKRPVARPDVMLPPHDPATGEILTDSPQDPQLDAAAASATPAAPTPPSPAGAVGKPTNYVEWDEYLADAATGGMAELEKAWRLVPKKFKPGLVESLDEKHKVAAAAADEAAAPANEPEGT